MHKHIASFRFYEELNDFLPAEKRKKTFPYAFMGKPSVKDAIEGIGVSHTEIDLILVNGSSTGFDYSLRDGDRVSVYPVFENLDISTITRLRPEPLRKTRFVLDVHLGKLARLLRMVGFDTLYRNDFHDDMIIETALKEQRIILTRDRGILKNRSVTHGYWIRQKEPLKQVLEVVKRFDLFTQVRPFSRCIECNGGIESVDKKSVLDRLPEKTATYYNSFKKCPDCGKIYWKGSHYQKMKEKIERILK